MNEDLVEITDGIGLDGDFQPTAWRVTSPSPYDRRLWPSVDANPLIILLRRGDDWYSNAEIVSALGLAQGRALLSNCIPTFREALSDDDIATVSKGVLRPGAGINRSNSGRGNQRMFSRRALVLAAMRANTVNAAAFRDWLATQMAGERH